MSEEQSFARVVEGFEAGHVVWNLIVGDKCPFAHCDKYTVETLVKIINEQHEDSIRAKLSAAEAAAESWKALYAKAEGELARAKSVLSEAGKLLYWSSDDTQPPFTCLPPDEVLRRVKKMIFDYAGRKSHPAPSSPGEK